MFDYFNIIFFIFFGLIFAGSIGMFIFIFVKIFQLGNRAKANGSYHREVLSEMLQESREMLNDMVESGAVEEMMQSAKDLQEQMVRAYQNSQPHHSENTYEEPAPSSGHTPYAANADAIARRLSGSIVTDKRFWDSLALELSCETVAEDGAVKLYFVLKNKYVFGGQNKSISLKALVYGGDNALLATASCYAPESKLKSKFEGCFTFDPEQIANGVKIEITAYTEV